MTDSCTAPNAPATPAALPSVAIWTMRAETRLSCASVPRLEFPGPADERRDDGEVRQVSGRKQQCSRARARSDPRGKLAIHRVVGCEMPGDEVRRAGADAVSRSALLRCRDDAPLAGQA